MIRSKPNYQIILRYLSLRQGERKMMLYKDHSLEFGMVNDRLQHILYTDDEEIWCESDMTLNEFIKVCKVMTNETIIGVIAAIGLTNESER